MTDQTPDRAAIERRLRISERRRDELREESLRRGATVLDYSEKVRALEKEIDGVRRQLGAEILRANAAEAQLRRMADEEQPATETCGRTKAISGTEYQPCARPAGHPEAYCLSADGGDFFLTTRTAPPAVVVEQPAATDTEEQRRG